MNSRVKQCHNCKEETNTMYRVQFTPDRKWSFLCKACVEELKPNNPHYRYGGTWKK